MHADGLRADRILLYEIEIEMTQCIIFVIQVQLDDSSDDEDVLLTDEVRSTEDQYTLKELRLPRTVCK